MSSATPNWTEIGLSEEPAVELLRSLGYEYAPADDLAAERESLRNVVLVRRLARTLKKLNPWLSDDNQHKAIRAVTNVHAASLIEANEVLYTALTHGITLKQNLGDGPTSHTVRFFDFERPRNNDFLVTRQFQIRGRRKTIIPDVVVFVNGMARVRERRELLLPRPAVPAQSAPGRRRRRGPPGGRLAGGVGSPRAGRGRAGAGGARAAHRVVPRPCGPAVARAGRCPGPGGRRRAGGGADP